MVLEYLNLKNEITGILEKEQNIVFATCANNIVSARTMCHVNDGLEIMFSTDGKSGKVEQIKQNPNIALAAGALQIEAKAELFGHPSNHEVFIKKNDAKFPWMKDAFKLEPDQEDFSMLVICHPTKITIYKYIDGKPNWDILYVNEEKAVRLTIDEIRF